MRNPSVALFRGGSIASLVAATTFLLTFVPCAAGQPAAGQLVEKIQPLIDAHQGTVAVIVKNLDSSESFEHNANLAVPTASLIKLPVMIEYYRQAAEGKLQHDAPIELKKEDKVPGSGILTDHFDDGAQISAHTAVRLMMRYSDNTATNLVVDRIGLPRVTQSMKELGLHETQLHSKVYRRDTSIDPDRSQRFGLGSTTANEMLWLLEKLHKKELVSQAASEAMLGHLASCDDDSQLMRRLPKSVKAYHKTGAVTDVRTDAGLFETSSGTIAMIVLTSKNQDTSWTESNAAEVLSGEIGRIAYDWFNPPSLVKTDSQPTIRRGASNEIVKALQRTLNARMSPSPELALDGDFGPGTEAAVKAFQRSNQLPADGIVEASTWAKLSPIEFDDKPAPPPSPLQAKSPADAPQGIPFVASAGWVVFDPQTMKAIGGANHESKLDFASTTKMMTAWLVAKAAAIDPKVLDERIVFSDRADRTIGSTSNVRAGESISLREALYGLMLPSGNDAAVAIGEHLGLRLKPNDFLSSKDSLAMFVAAMNAEAKELGMVNTHYTNPHGLTDAEHKSSCVDLALLAAKILDDQLLQEVVSTREFQCEAHGGSGYRRPLRWRNTNNLLGIEGYTGVKTGTTDAAGACLVSCSERDGRRLLVVVLGAPSSPVRYTDSRNLHRWGWQQLVSAGN